MNLVGRTAVVTGAARGIGRAYGERLAADGANVVAVDLLDPGEAVASWAGPGSHLGVVADLSRVEDLDRIRDTVLDRFGRCDILVNNAAIFPTVSLDEMTLEVWRRVQAVNVEAALILTQAFIPGMRAAGWGRIVNTGSGSTLVGGRDLAYVTSKGTVHALTRMLASELGDDGITVNAIAPSVVPTEGFAGRDRPGGATADTAMSRVSALQFIHRGSTPEDLAGTLSFLVSDDAAFITGQILHVDGGLTRSGA